MGKSSDNGREKAQARSSGAAMTAPDLEAWFVREVLPLESALMQFLEHNWRNEADIADLRQDVYERVCEAAQEHIPEHAKAFVFKTARNLLVDRVRRSQVVPIDAVSDFEALGIPLDAPGPDRGVIARDELRRLQAALDCLPPRCREAVVSGGSRASAARKSQLGWVLGTESTVSFHLTTGIRALVDAVYGGLTNTEEKP